MKPRASAAKKRAAKAKHSDREHKAGEPTRAMPIYNQLIELKGTCHIPTDWTGRFLSPVVDMT